MADSRAKFIYYKNFEHEQAVKFKAFMPISHKFALSTLKAIGPKNLETFILTSSDRQTDRR